MARQATIVGVHVALPLERIDIHDRAGLRLLRIVQRPRDPDRSHAEVGKIALFQSLSQAGEVTSLLVGDLRHIREGLIIAWLTISKAIGHRVVEQSVSPILAQSLAQMNQTLLLSPFRSQLMNLPIEQI